MTYQIKRTQQLNCGIDAAWEFFSSPCNLSAITPEDMNFTIVTQVPNEPVYEGMIIDYVVSPLWGVPLKWRTMISQVCKKRSFQDHQHRGPYKFWNHLHEFIPNEKGVLMRDTVQYELPLGFVGRILHKLVVRRKLNEIFGYRHQVVEKLFNTNIKLNEHTYRAGHVRGDGSNYLGHS